jgi:mannose-6-phosphate isomerase-like protein (cupin superfamily)
MEAYHIIELLTRQKDAGRPYLEFIRKQDLSVGLYVLPAGGVDPQLPHAEDEVYYVVSGKGRFMSAGDDVAVEAGSVLFVAAGVEHRFHDISEALSILVFFGPAEGSKAK